MADRLASAFGKDRPALVTFITEDYGDGDIVSVTDAFGVEL